jgi:hypothetical protein
MGERINPFSNGSQYMDWLARNCDRCSLNYDHENQATRGCEIEEALSFACIDDGKVSAEIARRCGITAGTRTHYTWDCPERRPIGADPDVPAIVPARGQLSLFDAEGADS